MAKRSAADWERIYQSMFRERRAGAGAQRTWPGPPADTHDPGEKPVGWTQTFVTLLALSGAFAWHWVLAHRLDPSLGAGAGCSTQNQYRSRWEIECPAGTWASGYQLGDRFTFALTTDAPDDYRASESAFRLGTPPSTPTVSPRAGTP